MPFTKSAQEPLAEMDDDAKAGDVIMNDVIMNVERMSHSPRLKKISTMAGTAAAMIHIKIWKSSISGYLVKD